jgi:type IV fimbrial biogenesis protein FimT
MQHFNDRPMRDSKSSYREGRHRVRRNCEHQSRNTLRNGHSKVLALRGLYMFGSKISKSIEAGFTVIELMITVVVVGILIALAAPSLREFVLQQQARASISEFHRGVATARAEAIRRNRRVTLSARAPCTGANFNNGWQVYVDEGTAPNQCRDGAETLIVESSELSSDLTVAWANADANRPYIIFTPTGGVVMANGASGASSWSVSVPTVSSIAPKTLCINFYGRIRSISSGACGAAG